MSTNHVNIPRVEHTAQAFGIGVRSPRLTWTVETTAQNWRQSAYKIELLRSAGQPPTSRGWHPGRAFLGDYVA
jgi:hypothetical protein